MSDGTRPRLFVVAVFLSALLVIITWPQALHLGSRVAAHGDPLLSMWRLKWIAHALSTDVPHLFDGNIFYPHARTLAYSDAMLLEGAVAAPWLWTHVNIVLVYNLLLFGSIVASGIGMFLLVRHLTGHVDAALVSAVIFTLAPYRIEHFMHLELQWTMWMPLTFLAVHRVFDKPTLGRAMTVGVLAALQVLSCLYYGAYLGLIVGVACVLLAAMQRQDSTRTLGLLALSAIIPATVGLLYARPYAENAHLVGTRGAGEIALFSATLASYVTAPEQNWFLGWTASRFNGNELHLFLGVTVLILAGIGVAARLHRRMALMYAVVAVLAVELSLGLNGGLYRWLYEHIWVFAAFRAPARFGILASCLMAVLAGFGYVGLERFSARWRVRPALLAIVLVAIVLESGSGPMQLLDIPTEVPDVYKFLTTADSGSLIEFPVVDLAPWYMLFSTHHWKPLVNGYSGFSPPDYPSTLEALEDFPDDFAISRLQQLNVRYIVVHEYFYKPGELSDLLIGLAQRPDITPLGRLRDWIGWTALFELRQPASSRLSRNQS